MNAKMLIATAAIAATAALATAPAAKADPHFGFSIGFNDGGFGFDRGPDPFWRPHHRPHYGHGYGYGAYAPPPVVNYGIGCGAGANIVQNAGFRNVQAVNCAGGYYTYQAWQRGGWFRVSVNTNGRIVQVVRF